MKDYSGVSVFSQMGYQLPPGYNQSLLKVPFNVHGSVLKRSPELPGLMIQHIKKGINAKFLTDVNKTFEGIRIVHFFGQYPDDYHEGSIQPYPILTLPSGDAALAATLVGDFAKHLPQTESTKHSAAWWCANEKIVKMCQRIWRLCKEDPRAFDEELKTMDKDFTDLIGLQGGAITLVLATADDTIIHQFNKSIPTFKKFQWGHTTDVLDYVTGVVETKKEVPVVEHKPSLEIEIEEEEITVEDEEVVVETAVVNNKSGKQTKGAEKKETTKTEAPKAKAEVEAARPIINKVTEKEIVLGSGAIVRRIEKDGKVEYLWFPPMMVTKKKNLRKAYLEVCGRSVSDLDMDNRIGVRVSNMAILKEVQKSFADLSVLGPPGSDAERFGPTSTSKETVKVQNKATGKESTVSVTAKKEEKPLAQPPSTHEEREKHPDSGSPIYSSISPVDKHFIGKHLDKNGMETIDPTKMQELEDTTKMFHEEFPLIFSCFEDTWKIKPEMRAFLNAKCPGAMAMWQGDLIRYCVNLTKQLDQLTDPDIVATHHRGNKKAKVA